MNIDLSTTYYLAIDPGGTCGWAAFDEAGILIGMGKIKGHDEFLDWLEDQTPKEYIVERYRNRIGGRGAAVHAFSENNTSQVIGAIKRVAKKRGIIVNLQDPSPGLSFGLRFLGIYTKYYSGTKNIKHVPDDISALAHGTYFLRRAGIQK